MNGLKGDGSGAYVDSLFKQDRSGSRCKVARTFKLLCESTVKLTATRGNCKSTMKKILVLERTIEQLHQLAEGPTALTPNTVGQWAPCSGTLLEHSSCKRASRGRPVPQRYGLLLLQPNLYHLQNCMRPRASSFVLWQPAASFPRLGKIFH